MSSLSRCMHCNGTFKSEDEALHCMCVSDDKEAPYSCVCHKCFSRLHRRHGIELTKHLSYPPKEPWHHHLRPVSDDAWIALGNSRVKQSEEEFKEGMRYVSMDADYLQKYKHYCCVEGIWRGGSSSWPYY